MGKPLLIIDDDRDIREALGETLECEGYEVRTAANGREALEGLRGSWRPEVILLDLMMPVMDGWEFRRHQLAIPELCGIPVLVLSADRNAEQAAVELRAAACLCKPLSLERLLEDIDRVTRR